MTTVYDVPASQLIERLAQRLKKEKTLSPPEWAAFVKTGTHNEKPPSNPDWWYVRLSAVLRKVYINGPIGSQRLTAHFGGPRDRRTKPDQAVRGSGSIARVALKQLEDAGFVAQIKGRGRTVTPKGRSLLDNEAHSVVTVMAKENPALAKY